MLRLCEQEPFVTKLLPQIDELLDEVAHNRDELLEATDAAFEQLDNDYLVLMSIRRAAEAATPIPDPADSVTPTNRHHERCRPGDTAHPAPRNAAESRRTQGRARRRKRAANPYGLIHFDALRLTLGHQPPQSMNLAELEAGLEVLGVYTKNGRRSAFSIRLKRTATAYLPLPESGTASSSGTSMQRQSMR